jgi:hypothetical protein
MNYRGMLALLLCVSVYGQQSLPFGSTQGGAAACGTPVLTAASGATLKWWYSADCMTAISPCATSYTNGQILTSGTGPWLDRSGNANNLSFDAGFSSPSCSFKLNQINGLPSVGFNADSAANCGWTFGTQPDAGATSWAIFTVFQNTAATTIGVLYGPRTTAATPGTFKYSVVDNDTNDCGPDKDQLLDKTSTSNVGCSSTSPDTSWHQINIKFSNTSDQNTLVFRRDRAADGPASFTSTNLGTSNGGIAEIGIEKRNSAYDSALHGRIAETFGYTGTGVLLSAGELTTNETYLHCRTGL